MEFITMLFQFREFNERSCAQAGTRQTHANSWVYVYAAGLMLCVYVRGLGLLAVILAAWLFRKFEETGTIRLWACESQKQWLTLR